MTKWGSQTHAVNSDNSKKELTDRDGAVIKIEPFVPMGATRAVPLGTSIMVSGTTKTCRKTRLSAFRPRFRMPQAGLGKWEILVKIFRFDK